MTQLNIQAADALYQFLHAHDICHLPDTSLVSHVFKIADADILRRGICPDMGGAGKVVLMF